MTRRPLVWPPKVGQRICLDTGHAHNSWSGEVRAIVDDDYAVVKRWQKRRQFHIYVIVDRLDVKLLNSDEARWFEGPLPRRRAS